MPTNCCSISLLQHSSCSASYRHMHAASMRDRAIMGMQGQRPLTGCRAGLLIICPGWHHASMHSGVIHLCKPVRFRTYC